MAIEVLHEGVPAGFEVLGVQDSDRQLDQPAAEAFQADLSSQRRLWERKLITVLMTAKVTRQVRQKSL